MWRWIFVVLLACEDARDFPAPPAPIDWTTLELAAYRGTIDGTGYQIDVPRGASELTIGRIATFELESLKIQVQLDLEAESIDYVVGDLALLDQKVLRDDGWSGVLGSGATVINYVYVDEGALMCRAGIRGANSAYTERMQHICNSLRATSGIANPRVYPDGLSPSKVRAAMCQIAIYHVRALEPTPKATKKKTKEQRAAEAQREEDLDTAYTARQTRCERQRWSTQETQCLVQARNVSDASACVPEW